MADAFALCRNERGFADTVADAGSPTSGGSPDVGATTAGRWGFYGFITREQFSDHGEKPDAPSTLAGTPSHPIRWHMMEGVKRADQSVRCAENESAGT